MLIGNGPQRLGNTPVLPLPGLLLYQFVGYGKAREFAPQARGEVVLVRKIPIIARRKVRGRAVVCECLQNRRIQEAARGRAMRAESQRVFSPTVLRGVVGVHRVEAAAAHDGSPVPTRRR